MTPPITHIYLDFDGVITTDATFEAHPDWRHWPVSADFSRLFDLDCLAAVDRLAHHFGAGFVLSTNWRRTFDLDRLTAFLRSRGLTAPILGLTPNDTSVEFVNYHPGDIDARIGDIRLHMLENNLVDAQVIVLDDLPLDWPSYRLPPPWGSLSYGLRARQIQTTAEVYDGVPAGFRERHITEAITRFGDYP